MHCHRLFHEPADYIHMRYLMVKKLV